MAKLRGNLLVGQSGGPTAAINSTLAGVLHEALLHQEIGEIYGMANGIQGLLEEEIYDLRRQGPDLVEGLRRTPASALGSCRYKLKSIDLDRLLDIPFTDHCPGYGSVARYIALSTMDAGADHRCMRSFDAVKIVEAMGRNAGWIAAASALGKKEEGDAPHLVYPPERPVRLESLLEEVQRAYDRHGFVTMVVSEALRGEDGEILVEGKSALEINAFGHRQPGGVAESLARTIMKRLGLKARADKPGTLQRVSMALASKVDLEEALITPCPSSATRCPNTSGCERRG